MNLRTFAIATQGTTGQRADFSGESALIRVDSDPVATRAGKPQKPGRIAG